MIQALVFILEIRIVVYETVVFLGKLAVCILELVAMNNNGVKGSIDLFGVVAAKCFVEISLKINSHTASCLNVFFGSQPEPSFFCLVTYVFN